MANAGRAVSFDGFTPEFTLHYLPLLFLLLCAASIGCSHAHAGSADPALATKARADCPQRAVVRRATINTPMADQRVILGLIRDAATNAPLGLGSVTIRGQMRGVRVDTVGRFQLPLIASDTGQLILSICTVGFDAQADTISLSASGGMVIDVFLTFSNVCLDPVVGGTVRRLP